MRVRDAVQKYILFCDNQYFWQLSAESLLLKPKKKRQMSEQTQLIWVGIKPLPATSLLQLLGQEQKKSFFKSHASRWELTYSISGFVTIFQQMCIFPQNWIFLRICTSCRLFETPCAHARTRELSSSQCSLLSMSESNFWETYYGHPYLGILWTPQSFRDWQLQLYERKGSKRLASPAVTNGKPTNPP